MLRMDAAFDMKDALVDTLQAAVDAAVVGGPLYEVEVHDGWPNGGIKGKRCVLVLDANGDEIPATMRAGGGTRDDTVCLDVAVAVWDYVPTARECRAFTKPIIGAVKALVRKEGAAKPGGVFGVAGTRQPEINSYRVTEFVLDQGRRECDVHLTLSFKARVAAT